MIKLKFINEPEDSLLEIKNWEMGDWEIIVL